MERWDETWHRLRTWTNSSAQAERLSAQLLLSDGYERLDPAHPLGGPDGTQDAIAYRDSQRWVMAVSFTVEPQSLAKTKRKLISDSVGVTKHDAEGIAFVTNQELSIGDRSTLADAIEYKLDLYHLERITAILDQPTMNQVRYQFLGIEGQLLNSSQKFDNENESPIRPTEFAFMKVNEVVQAYREFLAPMLRYKELADDSSLGILMCGSPPEYEGPDRETQWTVFVNPEWLRWYLAGQDSGFDAALKVPVAQIYGQVPAWPDSFFEFLAAIVETGITFHWVQHPDGYLVLAQPPDSGT